MTPRPIRSCGAPLAPGELQRRPGLDQAELDRGAALFAAGRTAEAVQTLGPLDLIGTQGYSYQNSPSVLNSDVALQFAAVSYYACEQLADDESESGDLYAAVEAIRTRLTGCRSSKTDPASCRRR